MTFWSKHSKGQPITKSKYNTMKLKIILFVCISFLLVLSIFSCHKNTVEIPTGDGTLSCYINGELFLPAENVPGGIFFQRNGLTISKYDEYMKLVARDYKKYLIYFMIVDYGEGTYTLSDSDGGFEPTTASGKKNDAIVTIDGVRYLSKEGSGTVTFTDTTGTELKGTFEFTLYNEKDDSDVIHVTDGRFDN